MSITERHEMQQDIALFNTLNARSVTTYFRTRKALARNMHDARGLSDSNLRRIAGTLPR